MTDRLSWWSRLLRRPAPDDRVALSLDEVTSFALLWGGEAKSGVTVSVDTALRCAAAFACARVLAEGIAQIPLKIYRETEDGGKEVARDHPVHRIVHRRPNPWMRSFEFRETLMYHAVLTGNGYAVINRAGGEIRELIPVLPGMVDVEQDRRYRLTYKIRDAKGLIAEVAEANMFHLRGPSWNGFSGMDTVRLLREAIGLAISAEENHAHLHKHGARPGGILTTEQALDEKALTRIKTAWGDAHGGVANAFKTAVLDKAMKWTPMTMSGVDSQHIETRKFQIEEVCRGFRVFPQMIGFADKTATYASAEQFFIAHVVHSLGPWIERWEQAIDEELLGKESREIEGRLFAKFSVVGMLRGDAKTRAAFYHSLVLDGIMTRNEARELEDMNKLDGLDEPLVPLNMGEVGKPDEDEGRPDAS